MPLVKCTVHALPSTRLGIMSENSECLIHTIKFQLSQRGIPWRPSDSGDETSQDHKSVNSDRSTRDQRYDRTGCGQSVEHLHVRTGQDPESRRKLVEIRF